MDTQNPVTSPSRGGSARRFLILGACLILGVLGVTLSGDLAHSPLLVIGLWLALGVLWGCALLWARGFNRGRSMLLPILVVAVSMRALALCAEPNLSDDVWRYVWEGGLVLEGKSPYAQAPDDPSLAKEREQWSVAYDRMNNKDVSAAYPPVTQAAVAAVVGAMGGSEQPDRARFGLRILFSCADLLALIPLLALLRRRGLPDALLVSWAWCPLVVFEFASSAHLDSLGILFLLSALALLDRPLALPKEQSSRVFLGLLSLSAAFLVKFLPLLAFPFVLRRRTVGASLSSALTLACLIALGFLPVLALEGGLSGILDGLANYGLRWESWNLIHRHVEPIFSMWGDRDGTWSDPRKLSKLFTGGLAALWMLRLIVRREEPVRATGLALAAFLIVSPTLHPWYLTWIIPFLAFSKGRAWMFLVIASPLLYWPLTSWQLVGTWTEPVWLWPLVALPFFGLLLSDYKRNRSAPHAR
jgi:hypothetical protein